FIYQLPVGRGRKYMNSGSAFAQAILGGWEMAGIWNWRSGLPVTISSATCGSCQMGGPRTQRPDVLPGVSTSAPNPNEQMWFNTAASKPAAGPFGTVGRATIYAPGLQQWDLTFAKDFPFADQRYVQFRTDFFNTFNKTNLNPPDGSASSSTFGRITSALPGRSIQLAV